MDAPDFPQGRLDLGTAAERDLRWAAVELTPVLEEARARLDLSPLATVALGRTLVGAVLLHALGTRRVDRLVVEVRGDGPLGQVVAEVDAAGNVRGTVSDPRIEPPEPEYALRLAPVIGAGQLKVIRETAGQHYTSQVELVSGELGDDFTHYLDQSEQIDSVVLLGVLVRPSGVAAAGGVIVEVMPGAAAEAELALEANLVRLGTELPGVSRLLAEQGLAGLVDGALGELEREVVEEREIRYRCPCNRERLRSHLAMFGWQELVEMARPDGVLEVDCVFCGSSYEFRPSDLAS